MYSHLETTRCHLPELLPDLLPENMPLPVEVIRERIVACRQKADLESLRLLQIAEKSLLFTEYLSREYSVILLNGMKRERSVDAPYADLNPGCFRCCQMLCVDDADWETALESLVDKDLPDSVRYKAAQDLRCCRRFVPEVADRLLTCITSDKSKDVRWQALQTAGFIGTRAAKIVPFALEIVKNAKKTGHPLEHGQPPSNLALSEFLWSDYHLTLLRIIANCHTQDNPEVIPLLCERTDFQKYGTHAAMRVIEIIGNAKAFGDHYLERMYELAVDESAPLCVRDVAIDSAAHLLHPNYEHIGTWCDMFANTTTPLSLRHKVCHALSFNAHPSNSVAMTFASVIGNDNVEPELRFHSLGAVRKNFPQELQRIALEPALRLANHSFPLPVADIAQDVIADVIRLAIPAGDDAAADFLRTALPAPFEMRLRSRRRQQGLVAARAPLLGRDIIADLLEHPWLKKRFAHLLKRRRRSLPNGTWEELTQQLSVYLLEVLDHPDRPLVPDPTDPSRFGWQLINRVDGFAKYHLPLEFGSYSQERHGTYTVASLDASSDLSNKPHSAFEIITETECLHALTSILENQLSNFERQVVHMLFFQQMTLDDAAAQFRNRSRYQVFRAKEAALHKLRDSLRPFAE